MNFLAHTYLSFQHPEILVGNMISDFVKGKKIYDFPPGIQQGILLHRQIDAFTDSHITTRHARTFFHPAVRLYSGAFVDVAYDHFLANDPLQFTDASLLHLASSSYAILNEYIHLLPTRFQTMVPFMQAQNWLYNYKTITGIKNSFGGLANRAAYLNSSTEVFQLFETHYAALQNCYNEFFPSLKSYTRQQFEMLAIV